MDAELRRLIARRGLLRWRFSACLIGAYLLWGVCGIYFGDFYAAPFLGIALPTGIAMGFMIIAASMVSAIVYVRVANRIESEHAGAGMSEE